MDPIDGWILDHAYAPDDIVLGDAGLTASQLSEMQELLECARPGWHDLFDRD